MSKIGYGYGSEWHLLRYLGYHRDLLNDIIERQTGSEITKWLDFKFSRLNERLKQDEEHEGLNFLNKTQYQNIFNDWKNYWPTSGSQQKWDAIAKANDTFVLVEAKANLEELLSSTTAKPASLGGGRDKIKSAFKEPMLHFTRRDDVDVELWLNKYYQYANRLAVLHYLSKHKLKAKLLFIYFTGDDNSSGICPESKDVWQEKINEIHDHLMIDKESPLMESVSSVFLPVNQNSN